MYIWKYIIYFTMTVVERINKVLDPYYALLITLGLFGTILISVYKFILSPTDLKVIVQNDEVDYPSAISKEFQSIYNKVNSKDSVLIYNGTSVYNFLVTTTDVKTIQLENQSEKTLRGVKFKHINADAITAYIISSDFFNNDEEKKMYENLKYDKDRGIIYLKETIDLPPKSSVKVKLWGSFKKSLIDNDILISYEDGDAYFEKVFMVTGLKGYIVEYSFELLFILFTIFVVTYHFGLIHAIKNITETPTEQSN